LLGVTFDPNFSANNFVYVYYTVPGSLAHNRVSRFTASGDVATPGSEFVLLNLNDLSSAGNHNGGAIHFGPDGKLYIAVGENANGSNSQTLSNLLGKMLRINSDGTIPTDNPFFNTATGVIERFGRWVCAIHSRSRLSPAPRACSSTTWAKAPGKKSMTVLRDRITAGRPRKVQLRIRIS